MVRSRKKVLFQAPYFVEGDYNYVRLREWAPEMEELTHAVEMENSQGYRDTTQGPKVVGHIHAFTRVPSGGMGGYQRHL